MPRAASSRSSRRPPGSTSSPRSRRAAPCRPCGRRSRSTAALHRRRDAVHGQCRPGPRCGPGRRARPAASLAEQEDVDQGPARGRGPAGVVRASPRTPSRLRRSAGTCWTPRSGPLPPRPGSASPRGWSRSCVTSGRVELPRGRRQDGAGVPGQHGEGRGGGRGADGPRPGRGRRGRGGVGGTGEVVVAGVGDQQCEQAGQDGDEEEGGHGSNSPARLIPATSGRNDSVS